MREISTYVGIDGNPGLVWEVRTDFACWIDRTLENFGRMNQPLKEWAEAKASAGAGR
ncbi:hypothetical protein [Streptomyces sp. DSM 40750]|uniref:hypothetical protein n=1 Tax=Streptomyces sp. DSM 40750 TaxID=2801030 RepID=UPI00214CDBF4|nr:hypothetical protein [Streptomyces sp. DSM 40750]UUU19211.1 hypothetical protein JIX55_02120 [Streptomyces sp. DSM 40750]UUU27446.1 hypothetical protein JIX55_48625 [Streptomyces sp. DSM 40750]